MNQPKNKRTPPPTWRYVDWIGGQEEFDKMFSEYPPELKAVSERTIMCADMINGVIECFWGLPEEYPEWVKKNYRHLTLE
jgi:hypothetical protein